MSASFDESKGTWGVRIPDLPGCYGAGASAEDAFETLPPPRVNGSSIRPATTRPYPQRELPPLFWRPATSMSRRERRL
jgi:hypothetical protein